MQMRFSTILLPCFFVMDRAYNANVHHPYTKPFIHALTIASSELLNSIQGTWQSQSERVITGPTF